MKLLIFNLLFLFICYVPSYGAQPDSDSTATSDSSVTRVRRWDKRVHLRYNGWQRLKPTHIKWQYAGGMGVSSFGVGWDYGKRKQWETDFLIGYLPARYADDFKLTFTVKQNYIPWSITVKDRWVIEPFYTGLYLTTITGDEFWKKEPGRYPNSYYNVCTKVRPYIFIGQRVGLDLPHPVLRNISAFYEISTCEMYLISKVTNKALTLKDILRFSFGLKFYLFHEPQ